MRIKTFLLLVLQIIFLSNAFSQLQVDYQPQVGDKLIYQYKGKRLQRWEITIKQLGEDIVYSYQQFGVERDSCIFKFSKENLEEGGTLVIHLHAAENQNCSDCCALLVSQKKFKEILKRHATIACDEVPNGIDVSSYQKSTFGYIYNGGTFEFKSIKVKSSHAGGEELEILDSDKFPLLLMFKGNFTLTLQQIVRRK
jgi:hypothetical protein